MDSLIAQLLPDPTRLRLESVACDDITHICTVVVQSTPASATCPDCGTTSTRIHSRYLRTLADLPWASWPVRLLLHVRKFFCLSAACPRAIFTERFPTIVTPWARRTRRLAATQAQLGIVVGGAAGERLAQHLAMPLGTDALLQLVRQHPLPEPHIPRVLGLDDWALCKGQNYGTILVDLETHQPIALLPDRSAETVAAWLRAHPGVEIIARDRASAYAEGAAEGAPDAIQVADRWHVIGNLGDALLRVLQQHQDAIEQVLRPIRTPASLTGAEEAEPMVVTVQDTQEATVPAEAGCAAASGIPALTAEPVAAAAAPTVPLTRREQEQQQRQAARQARYERVQELHAAGWSQRAIATELGLERKTVRKYLRTPASAIISHQPRQRRSLLDPYRDYILERWNAGCRNAMQILREIEAQGYEGKRSILRAFLTSLRKAQGLAPRSRSMPPGATAASAPPKRPSLRTLVWRILGRPIAEPTASQAVEQEQVVTARQVHPEIDTAAALAQEFVTIVRARQVEQFDDWMARAEVSGIAALQGFAAGVRQDEAAVRAALQLPWSTGPVEGQINRLKLLKRQSYGRAKLDLLERRLRAS